MGRSKSVTSKGCSSGPKKAKSQSQVVKELLKNAQIKLRRRESKPSLGDYIRLLQMQKELEEEEPREIKVTWFEKPPEKESGT
jgi:hypothetical protein